jgi:hypothetical protein
VAETIVKRLLCCRFRRTGNAMGHSMVWYGMVEDISRIECFPRVRISHVIRLISSCAYLLIFPRTFPTVSWWSVP